MWLLFKGNWEIMFGIIFMCTHELIAQYNMKLKQTIEFVTITH